MLHLRLKLRAFFNLIHKLGTPKAFKGIEGSQMIVDALCSEKPCMISRFGSTELQTLSYVKFQPFLLPFKKRTYNLIKNASGFFPVNKNTISQFYDLYIEDIKYLDILISWRFEEILFKHQLKGLPRVDKSELDNFFKNDFPWTQALKGKKILVVHPFAETIEKQYANNRAKLFKDNRVLPEFLSLQTVKAVQSVAGNHVDFDNWFDALDYMKSEIDKCDFEIAILGCGAYGMPLAAHIKRMGKKAVHMGGVTQFLFGIKGKRYEECDGKYINEYFVSPSKSDRPKNADMVEGGCYW